MIYRYVFSSSAVYIRLRDDGTLQVSDRTASTALFSVCRTCRMEADLVFSENSTVQVSHDFDWQQNGLDRMLLRNVQVSPARVRRVEHKIVLKQLGFFQLMCNPSIPFRIDEEDLDIYATVQTGMAVFPHLKTYYITPAILTCYPGVQIFVGSVHGTEHTQKLENAEIEAATYEATQDPAKHGVLGFLTSEIVQSQLLARKWPINRWMYSVAAARGRHDDWSRLPDVILDFPLYIYGEAWKAWPGLEDHDMELNEELVLKTPLRFADRVVPLVQSKKPADDDSARATQAVSYESTGSTLDGEADVRDSLFG